MFPYLTSRIKVQPSSISPNTTEENNILFVPMECPILPLDTSMNCIDMLHETFDEENGPLWRVQHVTEDTMDAANLVNIVKSIDKTKQFKKKYSIFLK